MISMDKKYRTRDGREVRIYAVNVDDKDGYTVHGAIKFDDNWSPDRWQGNGIYDKLGNIGGSVYDLIEVRLRIKREVWVNVYHGYEHIYSSKIDAASGRSRHCVACVKLVIDCEEGEGL